MSHCLMNKAPSVLWLPLVRWNEMYRIHIITGIPDLGSSCSVMSLNCCRDAVLLSGVDKPQGDTVALSNACATTPKQPGILTYF